MKETKAKKRAILDQAAESLDEATECLDEYTGRLDSTAVLMDGGTDLTDKGARILDSATESLDYGSRGMPRRAGFTHGNFGFGVRFLLDDAQSLIDWFECIELKSLRGEDGTVTQRSGDTKRDRLFFTLLGIPGFEEKPQNQLKGSP